MTQQLRHKHDVTLAGRMLDGNSAVWDTRPMRRAKQIKRPPRMPAPKPPATQPELDIFTDPLPKRYDAEWDITTDRQQPGPSGGNHPTTTPPASGPT